MDSRRGASFSPRWTKKAAPPSSPLLVLSPEHVALLEQALALRDAARTRIEGIRREKRQAQLTRALKSTWPKPKCSVRAHATEQALRPRSAVASTRVDAPPPIAVLTSAALPACTGTLFGEPDAGGDARDVSAIDVPASDAPVDVALDSPADAGPLCPATALCESL